jgi:hypothetical protein
VEIHQPNASPVAIPTVETDPGLAVSDERNDEPTENRRTTRSGREIQAPKHLRDFILLNKLSKQTSFAPTRNLPRIRCEVLNHQRLSTLNWDDLLTSIRGGSYGALLSFTQQHSDDGFLDEWHPSLLSTKANLEDNPPWNEAMNGPFSQGFRTRCYHCHLSVVSCPQLSRPEPVATIASCQLSVVLHYQDQNPLLPLPVVRCQLSSTIKTRTRCYHCPLSVVRCPPLSRPEPVATIASCPLSSTIKTRTRGYHCPLSVVRCH